MFPILYKKNETNFLHNGIGVLSDCISATATEERNGIFELEIEYDSDGQFADVIENDMIIKAKANDKQDPQLFRVYAVNKSQENDNLKISAQHITYDLAGNFVEKLELNNVTAAAAMEAIQNNLAYPTKFTIASTNTATVSSTKLYRTNPLQMIGGIDGSIIDNWGGEIERDNFRLILHAHRGSDNGVLVAYKKNLTGLEAKFDTSEVVTRIFPFKVLEDGTVITIPGKFIDSPLINNYPFIRILPIDASEDEDVTDQASLYAAYKDYFNSGAHDKPMVTLEVEFEPLWATEEYEDVAALELIGMGDTITVRNEKMGVDVTAEATKIEYDVLNEKNAKVTAGSIQTRLTDAVNGATSTVAQGIQQATQTANTALTAANGKNKIFYGPDEPAGANKDDVWFKVVDGEYTRTYRFDGIQWQLVVDADVSAADQAAQAAQAAAEEAKATAANAEAVGQAAQQTAADAEAKGDAAAKAAEEAKDAATKAQADAASAVTSANNAVSTANQATQDAQDAIDKAQDGFDKAQSALTAANNATDTANSFATRISNAEGSISTLTQTAQGLQSTVNGKVDKTTYNSFVTQTNGALQAKLSATDADKKYATQTALTATANSLTSSISAVQTNLDNLQVGGRNLIKNSNFSNGFTSWREWKPGTCTNTIREVISDNTMPGFKNVVHLSADAASQGWGFAQDSISVLPNTTYTYSFWYKFISEYGKVAIQISNGIAGFPINFYTYADNLWHRATITITTGSNVKAVNVYAGVHDESKSGEVYITGAKLEIGNKATDWTPAPEDMATQSQISQLSDDINLRVQKNDVINQINVSTESILISGNKVHITGQTTIDNAVIKDAMIDSVSANKLTAGTIDANVITVKNINASNIVTGTLDAERVSVVNLDASKITTGTLNAARIAAGSIDASKLAAGTITAASGVIGSLDASKITTGTLDAARVNVVNLTADSIKSGTLTSININGGNINIGGGKFTVDSNGLMSAVNATVTGSFSSSAKDDKGTWNASLSSGRIAMSKIGDASETGGQYVPIYDANISAGGIYTMMRRNGRPWNYVQMSAGAVGSNDTFISVTANEGDSSALYPDKLVVRNRTIVGTDGLHLDDDIVIGSGGWRALKFQTIRYNSTDYPSITQKDGKAGILFGSGYMYLLCSNKVVNLAQVYWPTKIDSSGRVVNWVNPLK